METTTTERDLATSEVTQTDETGSKMKKAAIILGGLAAIGATYFSLIRPWHLKWGATKEETDSVMPGDDLVPEATTITHAITIEAPVEVVWSLLAQLGKNENGIYQISWLENVLSGEDVRAGEAADNWRDLKLGDAVNLHTHFAPAPVVAIEPRRFLVLGLELGTDKAASWSFVMHPYVAKDSAVGQQMTEHTRLSIRFREAKKSIVGKVVDVVATEPLHFVLERKMLLTMKKLAEELVLVPND